MRLVNHGYCAELGRIEVPGAVDKSLFVSFFLFCSLPYHPYNPSSPSLSTPFSLCHPFSTFQIINEMKYKCLFLVVRE